LGIIWIIFIDVIREVMRLMFSEQLMPMLHTLSFDTERLNNDRRLSNTDHPPDEDHQSSIDLVHQLPLIERLNIAFTHLLTEHGTNNVKKLHSGDRGDKPRIKTLLDSLSDMEGPGR
jgi:hypothetical protein